ncbi:MAG TPA: hypothetical protein VK166_16975 [Chitinophagaceae bacterium]|nr:hypothetical protein [Chitinophagaceae bacterium]
MEWRKNLYDYEETPPNNAWEMISKELDSDVPAIREALYDYAEEPPVTSWQAITASLDQPTISPIYRYRKPLTYVAAAAATITGLIFFSNYFNTDKKEFGTPEISASVYKPVAPAVESQSSVETSEPDSPSVTRQLAVIEKKSGEEVQQQNDQYQPAKRNIASIQQVRFDPDDENYIYLTTSKGEVKRLSYKFEEMIPEMKKQDGEMIRKWKEKLEASSFIPAGNNFFDIAEMIRIMQEEKRP